MQPYSNCGLYAKKYNLSVQFLLTSALTVSGPVPGQGVVPVFLREGDSHGKVGDHALQQMNVQSTPHCQLVIFSELCGGLDGIFCVLHAFRSANSSSRSVYPFTAGSFAILSASSMAAIVSLLGWLRETSKGIRPSRRD